jgi:hypothetical protein
MKPLIRTLHPEVRVIDARNGLVEYVASDESLDSYREIIVASGWKFTNFKKNAPFVDSHDYYCIDKLLGRVVDFAVQGKQLVERVQWAIDVEENALARFGFKMTERGYLKAVSVGFIPVRSVSKWRNDPKEMADAVKELGIDAATAAQVCCIYQEQEQIELSACIIGANPNALAKAHHDGAISDADLDSIGFDDDAMHMLREFAAADEQANPQTRAFLRNLCGAYFHTLSVKKQNPQPATSAIGRAAAEEARQREQAQFLAEFQKAKSI